MITNSALSSDYEYCPQRDVDQPTVGITLATTHTKHFGAEVGYRRTWSDTVGLIGAVDRLNRPDLGLYPNEYGQAPATGIDEERLYTRAHADFLLCELSIQPFGVARFSLLLAALVRADAGVLVHNNKHKHKPAVE